MKGSGPAGPEPTTVSSAILFHCATVFPAGSAAAAPRVVAGDTAAASATPATATTRLTRPRTALLIIPPPYPVSRGRGTSAVPAGLAAYPRRPPNRILVRPGSEQVLGTAGCRRRMGIAPPPLAGRGGSRDAALRPAGSPPPL